MSTRLTQPGVRKTDTLKYHVRLFLRYLYNDKTQYVNVVPIDKDKYGSLAGGIPQVKGSNGPWGWPVVRQEEKKYQPPGSLGPRQPARRAIQGPWPLALGGGGGSAAATPPGACWWAQITHSDCVL